MERLWPNEKLVSPGVQENDDFWSLINLTDDAADNDLWMPTDAWYASNTAAGSVATVSSGSSPSSDLYCDTGSNARAIGAAELDRECTANDDGTKASQKRAKRQAQNRIAQQAFRARKEKLVRGLSVELNNLQCQYASTKAENEQLHNDLRLARTELSAIQSVLQHAQISPVGGREGIHFTSRPETDACNVSADPSSCTLTLRINIDGLLSERSRQSSLHGSEAEGNCPDVDLGTLCEPLCYQLDRP